MLLIRDLNNMLGLSKFIGHTKPYFELSFTGALEYNGFQVFLELH